MRPLYTWPRRLAPSHSTFETILRFGAVGLFTATIDVLVLYLLANKLGVHYFIAAGLSFSLAVFINYLLSIVWVFQSGKFARRTEVILFWAISAGGLCVNQIVMTALVGLVGVGYMTAKFCAIVLVTVWNFIGKKKVVFYDHAR